jgi:hypothetical protein
MATTVSVDAPLLFAADGSPLGDGQTLASTQDPLTVKVGPVMLGATAVDITKMKAFGLYVLRSDDGSTWRLWSEKAKGWVPADGLPASDRETAPLEYKADAPAAPWQGQVMLMGAKGKFAESKEDGLPKYAVQATFTLSDGLIARSNLSTVFLLPPPPGQNMPAGIKMKPDPEAPTRLELYLKDGTGIAGQLIIEQSGQVTLINKEGTQLVLNGTDVTVQAGAASITVAGAPDPKLTLATGSGATATLQGNRLELAAGGASVLLNNGNITLTPADADGWVVLNKRTRIEGQWQHPAV